MKKLLILLFSLLISFNSYGEWTKIGTNTIGNTYYLDIDLIKENNEDVYFWMLTDYLKPYDGYMSDKVYMQTNCGVLRYKPLIGTFYKQPMGVGEKQEYPPPPEEWEYPSTESGAYSLISVVCNYVNYIKE